MIINPNTPDVAAQWQPGVTILQKASMIKRD